MSRHSNPAAAPPSFPRRSGGAWRGPSPGCFSAGPVLLALSGCAGPHGVCGFSFTETASHEGSRAVRGLANVSPAAHIRLLPSLGTTFLVSDRRGHGGSRLAHPGVLVNRKLPDSRFRAPSTTPCWCRSLWRSIAFRWARMPKRCLMAAGCPAGTNSPPSGFLTKPCARCPRDPGDLWKACLLTCCLLAGLQGHLA